MEISKKSLSRRAAERNEELRTLWELELARFNDPDLFVFIDESAVDNRTVQRSQGWSAIGGRSVSRSTFLRGKRHSILPALSSDGIVALEIIEGSVNKELFLQFLRNRVAPQLNPFPGKKSVVIMDNCAIHHDEEIRGLIVDDCGVFVHQGVASASRSLVYSLGPIAVVNPQCHCRNHTRNRACLVCRLWIRVV